jgi:hypothetical protein
MAANGCNMIEPDRTAPDVNMDNGHDSGSTDYKVRKNSQADGGSDGNEHIEDANIGSHSKYT